MENIKLIKEPDCWCGPNSSLAEPEQFRDIPEDYFRLPERETKELEDLIRRKCGVNELGLPPQPDFTLKGASEAVVAKQKELARALDASNHRMKLYPEETKQKVEELWKLNNIMVYDLSNVEYDHCEAIKSLNELNNRLQAGPGPIKIEEMDQSNYKPVFKSKRMKLESTKKSPAKKYTPTIEHEE